MVNSVGKQMGAARPKSKKRSQQLSTDVSMLWSVLSIYLELRFSRPIRIIGTSIYIIQTVTVVVLTNQLMVLISHQALYTGLVIYAPALAESIGTRL